MKKTTLVIVLMLFAFQLFANTALPDSITQKLSNAKNDFALAEAYAQVRDFYSDKNIDSNLYYNKLLKALAQKNSQPIVGFWCDLKESFFEISDGRFREAYAELTEILAKIEALQPSENYWCFDNLYSTEKNIEILRFRCHYNFGIIASNVLNHEEAISQFVLAKGYAALVDTNSAYYSSCRNSIPFELYNQGRAAEGFKILSKDVNGIAESQRAFSYMILGKCLVALQNDSLAKFYLTRAIALDNGANANGRAAITLSDIYLKEKNIDSAFKYSKVVFESLKVFHSSLFELNIGLAYKNYSKCFSLAGNRDSALKYAELASLVLDSVDQVQKRNISAFQQFAFKETQKLQQLETEQRIWQAKMLVGILIAIVAAAVVIAWLQYKNRVAKQAANEVLHNTLNNLKSTQQQLIHAEKMASLGELTAGIAHEIQNPLNFVNNFSDLSKELIDEMNEELEKGDVEEAKFIAADIRGNLEKINHHGKRADSIVRGMLQHSRSSSGEKQDTDINKLADEYLRLSYHGLRSKDKDFNADIVTSFDDSIGKILIAPQEIGRVILNLVNNAFYAVHEKSKGNTDNAYKPCVTVKTVRSKDIVTIEVSDNGNGIPQKIKDKIFQPFFTTKPTGQGTGLGLSLSYDIVKAHGGEIRVDSVEGEGTSFMISLPMAS